MKTLLDILTIFSDKPPEKLRQNTRLTLTGLGLDSIGLYTMLKAIEGEYHITITEVEFINVDTIQQLCDLLYLKGVKKDLLKLVK